MSPFKQKLQLSDSRDVTTSTFTVLHVCLCGFPGSFSTDSPYHVGFSSYSAEPASACSRGCPRQMGPRGRREVIFALQPLFLRARTAFRSRLTHWWVRPLRQASQGSNISSWLCLCWEQYCLFGDNTVHFGRVEAVGSRAPRAGRGCSHLFYTLNICLLGAFVCILCKCLGERRPAVM